MSYKIGMVLEYDHGLFEAIENFLRGDENYNFLSEVINMDFNVKVRKKYPILMKIIEAAADAEGNVEEHIRQDFIKKKTDLTELCSVR